MAKRSHHHRGSSSTPGGSFRQFGCMGSLLHFFDFHQHFHIQKMLVDQKPDSGKLPKETKHVRNKRSSSKAHGFLDVVSNFAMEYNSTENSNGGKVPPPTTRASIDKDQMPKVLSTNPMHKKFPSRLTRTVSIHHLDCDDYMFRDTATDCEEPNESFCPYGNTNSSARTEEISRLLDAQHNTDESIVNMNCVDHKLPLPDEFRRSVSVDKEAILLEKLEAKSYANELREDLQVNRAKGFLDALELFNANREMFLKIIQDPNSLAEKYLQYLQDSSMDRTSQKTDSYPEAAGSSGQKIMMSSRHVHRRTEIEPSSIPIMKSQLGHFFTNFNEKNSIGSYDISVHSNHKPRGRNDDSQQYHQNDMKKRIKNMMKEMEKSKSGKHWISMDGVLHRVPYGHKISYHEMEQVSTSSGKRYDAPRFRKSLSLTESLDRYSSLFGSSLGVECKKQESNRSKLIQQDDTFLIKKSLKTLERIQSFPDFTKSSDKDAQVEVPEDKVFSFLRTPSDVVLSFSDASFANLKDAKHEEHTKPVHVLASVEDEACPESDNVTVNECHIEVTESSASIADVLFDDPREEIVIHDPLLDDLDRESESGLSSDPDKTFQAPDSNEYCQYDSISQSISFSEVHSEWEGSSDDYSEGLDSNPYSKNKIPEIFHADQTVNEITSKLLRPDAPNLTSFRLQDSNKDEDEFNYVLDILKKSGFDGNKFLGRWYSPDLPLDPSLFQELEGLNCDIDNDNDEFSINLDHLLLFDLINEVLMEICESSFVVNNRPFRPVHVRSTDLEKVWDTIRWHLNFHPEENPKVEYIVSRDLKETDKWTSIGYQTDDIGREIEEMILENLVGEVILELF